ncbi:N-acetyltransferase family protein [Microvirga sp. M2]|uniref:GNAT family N-acetyltransferase n=1 Tax=Microvirga sp. M2 TaxID=3073270 RepID=UPI0039C4101E
MKTIIRDGGVADIEGIARVHVQGWRESYKDILPAPALAGLTVEARISGWRHVMEQADDRSLLLVAEDPDGDIVGFAQGGPVRPDHAAIFEADAEIYAIYLLDTVKRQGLGRALLGQVFAHLARQNFRSAGLWVLKDNHAARGFYETFGGKAGREQELSFGECSVTEIAYRFDPIPQPDH